MESIVQQVYDLLGIGILVNDGDVFGFSTLVTLFIIVLFRFVIGGKASKELPKSDFKEVLDDKKAQIEKVKEPKEIKKPKEVKVSWTDRLSKGLSRSRSEVWGKIGGFFKGEVLSSEELESIEEILYSADLGPALVSELIDNLKDRAGKEAISEKDFKQMAYDFLKEKMEPIQSQVDSDLFEFNKSAEHKTKVIMIVGVNGAGKTTTIGKLAMKLSKQGANVVVGACDTFRAAAVDQLAVWCERAGVTMIRGKEGSNPSGVGFEALQSAIAAKADFCILDTAGRLHTKENLMGELAKSKKVLQKLDESAPQHTLLVIDAITGQNALRQAEEFNKALNLTGLIFTKCDGSSKAGSAASIVQNLKVPITYIGVGEEVEDLNAFSLDAYLSALVDLS